MGRLVNNPFFSAKDINNSIIIINKQQLIKIKKERNHRKRS
jgi:hypothetical protein